MNIAALARFDDISALGAVPQVALHAVGYDPHKIGIVRKFLGIQDVAGNAHSTCAKNGAAELGCLVAFAP